MTRVVFLREAEEEMLATAQFYNAEASKEAHAAVLEMAIETCDRDSESDSTLIAITVPPAVFDFTTG